ncbi:hypothetical protein NFI96_007225 [Prochilodus magdalenae]|nr:hypothetical protein NFI96_007225 [Prochilodus magdalenae]
MVVLGQSGKASTTSGPPDQFSDSFAENTMNELLGWYGYDKVELRDSDDIEIRNYPDGEIRQHISVLKENSLPKASMAENSGSPPHANSSSSTPTPRNGVVMETAANPSSSSSSSSTTVAKEQGGLPIIVPLIPPPLIKPPAGPPQDHHRAGSMWVVDHSQHCSDTDVVVVC